MLGAFFLMPFLKSSVGFTHTVYSYGRELALDGQLLNYLLWLVPACAIYIVLGELGIIRWQQDVARMILLIVAGYFFLHYGMFRKGASMQYLGIGFWVMTLGAVLIFFANDIKRAMGQSSQEEDGEE